MFFIALVSNLFTKGGSQLYSHVGNYQQLIPDNFVVFVVARWFGGALDSRNSDCK